MAEPIRAMVIKGDFTEAEFTELVALLRRFNTERPDAQLRMLMIDPEGRETELLELLAFPTPRKWAP
jgi:hypothetical protein